MGIDIGMSVTVTGDSCVHEVRTGGSKVVDNDSSMETEYDHSSLLPQEQLRSVNNGGLDITGMQLMRNKNFWLLFAGGNM